MNTKLKDDIAEQAAILERLRRGWGMLKPIGDRLPYDLAYDVGGVLVRVQVKSARFSKTTASSSMTLRWLGSGSRRTMGRVC